MPILYQLLSAGLILTRNPPIVCRRVVSLKFTSSNVYSFIRLPTFAINSLTGSNSGFVT